MAEGSGATAQEILPIERGSIHRISSGLGIVDLAGAVKELVENSLDSGANRVDVRLKEYGADLIEVADNGPGVSPEYYQAMTLKYYTSKILKFEDLQRVSTFGFRGEALSSLCTLSRVTITTRTADDTVATRLEYDLSGDLVAQTTVARCVGTTVSVSRLFSPLPVRYSEFKRHVKREYGKLVTVLQAYALISKRVRLLCTNQACKAGRTVVIQTEGSLSMRNNIISVFGTKTSNCLEWIDLLVGDKCRVEGFLSRPRAGSGRAARDRQFFFINGRPVDMPKAAKALNELHRSFNLKQFPVAVINFTLPTTAYDVNVSPDKRKVFVRGERDMLKAFIAALTKECAPFMHTATEKNLMKPASGQPVSPAVQFILENSELREIDRDNSGGDLQENGDFEREELPICATSDRDITCGDLRADWDLERDEVPICSTSDTAEDRSKEFYVVDNEIPLKLNSFLPNQKLKSFEKDSRYEIPSTASPPETSLPKTVQATLTGFVSQCRRPLKNPEISNETLSAVSLSHCEMPTRNTIQAKVTGLASRCNRPVYSEEHNGILSTTSFSAGFSSMIPSETQQRSAVQTRLSSLVSRFKRSREELEECPRFESGGQTSTGTLDGNASKGQVQQLLQPNKVRQGNLSKWFTGSKESSENDVHKRALPSKFESHLQETGGSRSNAQGELAKPRYFSSALQDEFSSESPFLLRSRQVSHALADESSRGNICVEGDVSKFNHADSTQQKPKPTVSGSEELKQTTSVLRFNRVTAPEVSEAVSRPKKPSVIAFDRKRLQMLAKRGFLQRGKERIEETRTERSFTFATVGDNCIAKTAAEKEELLRAANEELEQKFNKADFKHMKAVGQFDLRFILAKLDQDIFIVDQHAADEIYNFEHLMRTAVLNSQLLSRPVPLELDDADEKTVTRHKKTFRNNGFEFLTNTKAPVGRKLQLSAVPSCTDGMLGVEDIKELISLLANRTSEGCTCDVGHVDHKCSCQTSRGLPRPSRVRAMLASQSCKSSRKVGDALSMGEMEEVVSHLAGLEAPWTCPHGRPTVRHMLDLSSLVGEHYARSEVNRGSFVKRAPTTLNYQPRLI